ncbi:cache domain-containing protein [Candidatus Riflebacteria bacterium]
MKFVNTIRFKLIISFFLITVISGFLVVTASFMGSRQTMINKSKKEFANYTSLIKNIVEGRLTDSARLLRILATRPEIVNFDRQSAERTLNHYLQGMEVFYNVFVFDKTGQARVVAYKEERNLELYYKENYNKSNPQFASYANEVLKSGKTKLTNTLRLKNGLLLMSYIVPIKKDNKVIGVVSGGCAINEPQLKNLLNRIKPSTDGYIALLEKQGHIAASNQNLPAIKLDLSVLKNKKNEPRIKLPGKKDTYIFHLESIAKGNLLLLTALPDRTLFSFNLELALNIFLYSLLSFFLAALFSAYIAGVIVKPIEALVTGLKNVGDGIFSERVSCSTGGEMHEAISAFNDMVDSLQKNRIIEKLWNEHWDA